MRPKVSVIMPCYKVENYLDRCMDSVVNQTLKDIEIILVDDKSPDGTPDKCDEWAQNDPRVKVVHKSQNEGLGYARNTGLEKAKGIFVAFLDSDDFVDINMYKSLYDYAEKNKLEAVFCGYKKYYDETHIREWKENDDYRLVVGRDDVDRILLDMVGSEPSYKSDARILSSVWKGIYSIDVIRNNNLSFETERIFIAEDIIFHIDFLPCCNRIGFIPQTYHYYCDNGASLTQSFKADRFEKELFQIAEMERRLESKGFVFEEYVNRVDRYLLLKLRVCISQYLRHTKKTGYFQRRQNVRQMIMEPRVREMVRRYPYYKLDYAHKTFFLFVKYKFVDLVIILLSLR